MPFWIVRFVALALFTTFVATAISSEPTSQSQQKSSVTVFVRDGRVLEGAVDSRTNEQILWLRFVRGSVSLSSGLTWDLVERVEADGQSYSSPDFMKIASRFTSDSRSLLAQRTNTPRLETMIVPQPSSPTETRIQMLELNAEAANWDRDAEADGIVLHVMPRNLEGRIMPVSGVLSVTLVGRNYLNGHEPQAFPVLGRWSQRMRQSDFDLPWGANYRLPLHISLDHDHSILPIGMVEVRMNVAGQGDFEASTPVRLRTYNPLRDQLDYRRMRYDTFGRNLD